MQSSQHQNASFAQADELMQELKLAACLAWKKDTGRAVNIFLMVVRWPYDAELLAQGLSEPCE